MLRRAALSRHGAAALCCVVLPWAAGHVACVALAGAALVLGASVDRALLQALALALLAGGALWHLRHRAPGTARARRCCQAGVALGSFLVASAQGAGLMLVPLLAPLCVR